MELTSIVSGSGMALPAVQEGLGSLGSRGVQILSSDPVRGGIHSYGKTVGLIASIAIIILLVTSVVRPVFNFFSAIITRFQTHSEEMEKIRQNLAENRLQAILQVLPENDLVPEDLHINRADYVALQERGYTPRDIESALQRLGSRDYDPPREIQAIAEGRKKMDELYHSQLSSMDELIHLIDGRLDEIERLAHVGVKHRNLERFLISDGAFGDDNSTPEFRAALELIRFSIGLNQNDYLIEEFNAIKRAVEKAPKEGIEVYLQKEVRERLDLLQQSASYKLLVRLEGRSNPYVRHIQNLSLAIRLDSGGIEQLRSLGFQYLEKVKENRGEVPDGGQMTYLSDAVDDVIGKHHWSYKYESFLEKVLVWISYPSKTLMAAKSHKPSTALDYNSYQVGNHDMAYGDYSLGGYKMRAIHGPTPTADQLLHAQLEAQREVGGIHLQHNLEHPAFSPGDHVRTKYLMEVEREYPETFRLLSTPLDGPGWSLRGETGEYFMDYNTVEEFFLKYGTYAFNNRRESPAQSFAELEGGAHRILEGRRDNGFYVGPKVMTDEQFRLAFEYASRAFSFVEPEKEPHQKRLTKALQVGVQGFIAVGAMIQTLKDAYPNPEEAQEALFKASFGQACKLDIDRGVVLNVMSRVYFQLAAGKELTEEDISEIIGTVVGRAELVSGRTIISDRYQPLSDALRLIGGNEGNIREALQGYIREGFGIDPAALDYQSSS